MSIPRPSAQQLRRLAGDGAYQRGVDYARGGRVAHASWDGEAEQLSAEVYGTGMMAYRCRIRFRGGAILATVCSCPVQRDCKHVVAALLAAPPRLAERQAVAAARRDTQRAAWRRLAPQSASGAQLVPLALGLELRVRPPRSRDRWGASPARTATPRELTRDHGEVQLSARPLMRSETTGKWIQGDVTWDGMRRPGNRFDVAQARWFTDFLAIARDSLLSGTASEWIPLDRVESPLLWQHLRSSSGLGIAMIAAQKHTTVRLAGRAEGGIRIDRDDEGGLRVDADITIDAEPVPTAQVRPIGRTGVYHWEVVATGIQVALAPVPLSAPVHAAITAGDTIEVSAADRGAFLTEVYPVIARQSTVTAARGLALPVPVRPVPLLRVAFRSADRVEHRFEWEYAGHPAVPVVADEPVPGDHAFRDADAERQELRSLERIWASATPEPFQTRSAMAGVTAAEWATTVLPAFEDSEVRVVVTGRRKQYRELTGTPEITVSTVESTDPDWFDLGVIVKIDGVSIPFTPLFTALSMRRTKLMLVDGSYFSLAHPALQALRELIDEAADLAEWETGPRISRHQTALWADFEDLADQSEPAVSWRALAEGLRDVQQVPPAPVPEGLNAQLRPYQKQGFDWLAFLWSHGLGGVLADDMGLGKTLQLLALVVHAREQGEQRPFLVIAPTSVLGTWRSEAARFAPGLRLRIVEGSASRRRERIPDAVQHADVIVTSYTLLRLDDAEYADVEWAGAILDEAQFAKNPATKAHKAIAALRARVKIAVTGTPLENSLTDLWALFSLTAPGLFPSARRFREEYVQPIEKGKVPENEEGGDYRQRRLERLRRRIRPLMLRRTKEVVAADLPEKQVQEVFVDLAPAHRARYDAVLQRERQKLLGLLADLDRNRFIVFRSLTMLRMLSLAPGLIDPADAAIGSSKLDVLIEHVQELRAEGHRALVFSQFTSFLDLAEERLTAAGIAHVHLDGSTRNRTEVIDGFKDGEQPVFLISLKAGGFGLTLTEADYVFLLDPWWNPAAEAQAIDRTHRIGQTRRVFVYRLIASGTIEEKVLALQQRKARLFTAVMDDDELFSKVLTADDIRGLLEA
ncbi:DEAD/DEAH box helicase [Microbacterium sp. ARD32]|uniref:DEAD/DEAH box helicase n=1 Tax=Microbacterium sp. ARD32 TaxID=2962577 RepID=UPI0028829BC5|nr:DEAD/DEAH box helicase [Microbacterium sp. ARD32]MDT0157192.1 DEAD/DEAH box helicase [Microbacterium sp. ARD32]